MALQPQPLDPQLNPQQQLEAERMRKVLWLLDNLAQREDATVKGILDQLYDIGAAHWINDRIQHRCLNQLLHKTAKLSRPAFRMLATRWFQKNCPRLIANWLYTQACFQDPQLIVAQEALAIANPELLLPVAAPPQRLVVQEMQRLRRRIRRVTLLSIGAVLASGCLGLWVGQNFNPALVRIPRQPADASTSDAASGGVPVRFEQRSGQPD
ncbi:MAG: hypothetical protein AAGF24_00930 [Cyanobacteria bacterium P01_H01_bin.121]